MPPDHDEQDAAPTTRRRLPGWIWVFAPLAIGLLYAAGHALFAPKPTMANLPPPEAVLVQRFRNLDVLDEVSFGPRGPDIRAPRDLVAKERNVPGLPGVDHTAPIHLVLLPRGRHQDASMAIFTLEDADAFEEAFARADFLERGLIRNAQHLHVRGDHAAVGPSRDIVRRIGHGDLTCEDLGEDYAIAADVPGLVGYAMSNARQYPWRGILEALGVQVDRTRFVQVEGSVETRAIIPGAQRVERIRTAWDRVKLWGWMAQGRIRVDLHPAPEGSVAKALATRNDRLLGALSPIDMGSLGREAAPYAPADAEAWIRVPYDVDRALLADVLLACGVRFVTEDEGADLLGGLGAGVAPRMDIDRGRERGVLLWATKAIGTGYAWTLGLAAPSGHLPPLKAFLPVPEPLVAATVELPEDAAPITKGDTRTPRRTPEGTLALAPAVPWSGAPEGDDAGVDVVTFGPSAEKALADMRNHLSIETTPPGDPREAWDPGEGMQLVASFFLENTRAPEILGKAVEEGGFLAALARGHVRGALYTDGTMFRLHLWREAP